MAEKLHLRIDMSCRLAGMFRPIPYHDSAVRAHCGNDVRVLGLVSGLVHFPLVIYFLHNVEFDLHDWSLFRR